MTAHVLNLKLELMLCSFLRALYCLLALGSFRALALSPYLECEMLKKVSCAVCCICLRPATGIDPNTDRRRLSPWRVLGGNLGILSVYCRRG